MRRDAAASDDYAPSPEIGSRVSTLQETFATRRRVLVEGLLAPRITERIAEEMVSLPYEATANVRFAGLNGALPSMWVMRR